jgi:homogentisate 1,2-dioxygenase
MMYHQMGTIPPKRHIQLRKPDGGLYTEEVFGREGFSGNYSVLYHIYPPTNISHLRLEGYLLPEVWDGEHRHHLFRSRNIEPQGDPVSGRKVVAFNDDVALAVARPEKGMDYFYRNALADELIFIHEGEGTLESVFGTLTYGPFDYLVVPRGTTYRLVPKDLPQRYLVIEGRGQIEVPRRYRNEYGQLLEHAPFYNRDIRRPERLLTMDEKGEFPVKVKVGEKLMLYQLDHHPLDVVGWDGYLYPWAFSMKDFEPITGRIHQPPPVHQTFECEGFVVCSFVPRKVDYHPFAIKAPYNHYNIDSDEVLYYVDGKFMSRVGIEPGAFTLHPHGLVHGPQPGAVEATLNVEAVEEWAVMMDTFRPLKLTTLAREIDDPDYPYSWVRR